LTKEDVDNVIEARKIKGGLGAFYRKAIDISQSDAVRALRFKILANK